MAEFTILDGMTFYEATRHSHISRNLKNGVPFQIVSESVGHSTPVTTMRYYNHFVRKDYPAAMREGLGLGVEKAGELVPITPGSGRSHGANGGAGVDKTAQSQKKKTANLLKC